MSRGRRLLALNELTTQPSLGRRARGAPRSPARPGREAEVKPCRRRSPGPSRSACPGPRQRAQRGSAKYRRCLQGGGWTSAGRRRRQGERSRSRSPRSAACAATPAHGRSADSGTAPSRGSAWEIKAHKPGAGMEAAPLRRGPWRAPASSGFGWGSRAAPLRSAGVREGSGQVAPRPSHVAILFSRASPGLLGLPFAPAVTVVRGKQGTDGSCGRRHWQPLSPDCWTGGIR